MVGPPAQVAQNNCPTCAETQGCIYRPKVQTVGTSSLTSYGIRFPLRDPA